MYVLLANGSTLLGVAIIALALRDIVHTLFRPSGWGSISERTMRLTWRAFHHTSPRRGLLPMAGPVALLAVLIVWAVLLAVGWALVYLPYLPASFHFATGLPVQSRSGFVTAIYISFLSISTLGYGDITPVAGWLRIALPVEALMGFLLLSAAISWMLSIYPVLGSIRALGLTLSSIATAEKRSGVATLDLEHDAPRETLAALASSLSTFRADLRQFPIAYYFLITDEEASPAAQLGTLFRLRDEAAHPARPPNVRYASALLASAMDNLACDLGAEFLDCPDASTDDALRAFARDHRQDEESRRKRKGEG